MVNEANDVLIRIKAEINDFQKNTKKVESGLDNLDKTSKKSLLNFKNVAETALGFGFANLAGKATNVMKDFALTSAKNAIATERAFNSLQLQTSGLADTLVRDLSKASNQTVNNLDLIGTANKALALGISQNQLPELMETASARAKVMGISVTQAFNDIATGIGRQSKLILDNLGIIVNLEDTYSNYAATIGKTANQLSEFEKKQALTNQIIQESEAIVIAQNALTTDMATRIEQAQASVTNFGDAFAKTFLEDILILKDFISITGEFAKDPAWQEANRQANLFAQEIIKLDEEARSLQQTFNDTFNSLQDLKGEFTITGTAEFNLKEAKEVDKIDRLRLDLMREQNWAKEQGLEDTDRERNLQTQIEERERSLQELRLQNKIESENALTILQAQTDEELLKFKNSESTLGVIKDEVKTRLELLDQSKEEILLKKDLKKEVSEVVDSEVKIREEREKSLLLLKRQKDELRAMSIYSATPTRSISTPTSFGSSSVFNINMGDVTTQNPDEFMDLMQQTLSGKIN